MLNICNQLLFFSFSRLIHVSWFQPEVHCPYIKAGKCTHYRHAWMYLTTYLYCQGQKGSQPFRFVDKGHVLFLKVKDITSVDPGCDCNPRASQNEVKRLLLFDRHLTNSLGFSDMLLLLVKPEFEYEIQEFSI